MRNFQEKNKFKKFLQSKPVLVILTIMVFLFAWNIVNLTIKLQETYKNKNIEQQKIFELENRKIKLSTDIEKLGTDNGKEEVIRENFGMVKEGEQVVVIVDDKSINEPEKKEKSGGIINFFKSLFNK
ncbi:MAG: septum formation initiator family protein [bacterium]